MQKNQQIMPREKPISTKRSLSARLKMSVQYRIYITKRFITRLNTWLLNKTADHIYYKHLSERELLASRKSDTVFIFGSSYSLNTISEKEWKFFETHETVGFNWFVHQNWIRCDFHLIRGISNFDMDKPIWKSDLEQYFNLINSKSLYSNTIFLVQKGFAAINGNRTIGLKLLPKTSKIFRWKKTRGPDPKFSFDQGLSHNNSSLDETVNFAFLMGWKHIVLVGVDLYDRRYFWLPSDEARLIDTVRNFTVNDPARDGKVESVGKWKTIFEQHGVNLYVYNPKSLLADVLPVYEHQQQKINTIE
tara:strand:+ start:1149 stop:2060 length:912 start_codon:yes stop_codon:yes gene_type:complete